MDVSLPLFLLPFPLKINKIKKDFNLLILEREERGEGEGEGEGESDLLFHLCMHSLVDSCMCPDLG